MKRTFLVLFSLVASIPAMAEETPVPLDWRNEEPGWGFGLQYGPSGPAAVLRGWSSPALSIDIEGGLSTRTTTAQGMGQESQQAQLGAWVGIAPRIRVVGTTRMDINVVPSLFVNHSESSMADSTSKTTTVNGALGVAVDRWFAPGVSFTGRLDVAQVGIGTSDFKGSRASVRSAGVQLVPSVAVHVYPAALQKRRSQE